VVDQEGTPAGQLNHHLGQVLAHEVWDWKSPLFHCVICARIEGMVHWFRLYILPWGEGKSGNLFCFCLLSLE